LLHDFERSGGVELARHLRETRYWPVALPIGLERFQGDGSGLGAPTPARPVDAEGHGLLVFGPMFNDGADGHWVQYARDLASPLRLTTGPILAGIVSDTGRLETFADGVFAIAITLLVLGIHLPAPDVPLGPALLEQWPEFGAYVVSFLTIGIMWVQHHRLFTVIGRSNATFA